MPGIPEARHMSPVIHHAAANSATRAASARAAAATQILADAQEPGRIANIPLHNT